MTVRARLAAPRSRCDGFTLFELAVATVIVAVLTYLLLLRLHSYQREAQQVAVQHLVGTLRTALSVRSAQLSVAKKEHELPAIIDENPMFWLIKLPSNYLGEYYSPEGNSLPDDSWYFDRGKKELVYIAADSKSFPKREQTLLKFKVKFIDLTLQQGKIPGLPAVNKGVVLDQVSEKNVVN
jgi:prepilin-type N-terminal cleavage/methylation domain-containing protein